MILVCAGVFAAILVRALMVDMPRAVRSLDELERYLPRAMGGSA